MSAAVTQEPYGYAVVDLHVQTASNGRLNLQGGGDGLLWFTDFADNLAGSIDPATKTVTKHSIPVAGTYKFQAMPQSITATAGGVAMLLRYGWAAGANSTLAHYYNVSYNGSEYVGLSSTDQGIAAMPDGSVYYTGGSSSSSSANTLFYATAANTHAKEVAPPTATARISDPTLGSDGNIYFIDTNVNVAGRYNVSTKTIDNYAMRLPGNASVSTIVAGPQSQVWVCDANGWATVNTATPKLTTFVDLQDTDHQCPGGQSMATVGTDGALWYAAYGTRLMRVAATTRQYSSYYANVPNSLGIASVASGSDGNIWFYASFNQLALFKRHTISTAPAAVSVPVGGSTSISVAERQYTGSFAVDAGQTCASNASVSQTSPTTFSITGVTAGSCSLSISDANGMARVYVKVHVTP